MKKIKSLLKSIYLSLAITSLSSNVISQDIKTTSDDLLIYYLDHPQFSLNESNYDNKISTIEQNNTSKYSNNKYKDMFMLQDNSKNINIINNPEKYKKLENRLRNCIGNLERCRIKLGGVIAYDLLDNVSRSYISQLKKYCENSLDSKILGISWKIKNCRKIEGTRDIIFNGKNIGESYFSFNPKKIELQLKIPFR